MSGGTVTLTGNGTLSLGNGALFLGNDLNLVVNATGNLVRRPAGRRLHVTEAT